MPRSRRPGQRTARPGRGRRSARLAARSASRHFSCGSTSSSRTRLTGSHRMAGRRWRATTTKSRRRTQAGRLIDGLGGPRDGTLMVVAGDHGEAFGEHGEIATACSSTTPPCECRSSSTGRGWRRVREESPVSLVDVAPTIVHLMGLCRFDGGGVDRSPAFQRSRPARRRRASLYAESFAPLLDFGWSPLRASGEDGSTLRRRRLSCITSTRIPARTTTSPQDRPRRRRARVNGYSPASWTRGESPTARRRAAAVAWLCRRRSGPAAVTRADPKDRRELAAAIAQIMSGELHGEALERELRRSSRRIPTIRR